MKQMNFFTIFFTFGIILLSGLSVDSHGLPARTGKDSSGTNQPAHDATNKDAKPATKNTEQECSKACRPTWLSQVTMYLGTVQSASHPMCAFKDRFPDCTTSSTCSKKNTNCCPIRCLKEIKACWKGTESICVPETISYDVAMKWAEAYFRTMG